MQLFKRSTNNANYIPEIDGLRFYAIITVVVFHLNTAFSRAVGITDLGLSSLGGKNIFGSPAWWIVRLDLGVKVFFAISGMVLALPFLKHYLANGSKVLIKEYYYKRITRLEPPFLLSLLFFMFVHVIMLGENWATLIPHFFSGVLYSHVFLYGFPNPINPVTWSLETEAQFYLVVPFFFLFIFLRRTFFWYTFCFIFSFALSLTFKNLFIQHSLDRLASSVIAYFSNFLVGIVFAWIFLIKKSYFDNKLLLWDLIGMVSIFCQFFFYKPQHDYFNNLLFNLSIFFFMFSAFKGRIFNRIFSKPIIYLIGGMCYSIYLLHFAFFHLLLRYTSKIQLVLGYGYDLLLQILIAIPSILIVAAIFYLLVEKPCMDNKWPYKLANYFRHNFLKSKF